MSGKLCIIYQILNFQCKPTILAVFVVVVVVFVRSHQFEVARKLHVLRGFLTHTKNVSQYVMICVRPPQIDYEHITIFGFRTCSREIIETFPRFKKL